MCLCVCEWVFFTGGSCACGIEVEIYYVEGLPSSGVFMLLKSIMVWYGMVWYGILFYSILFYYSRDSLLLILWLGYTV